MIRRVFGAFLCVILVQLSNDVKAGPTLRRITDGDDENSQSVVIGGVFAVWGELSGPGGGSDVPNGQTNTGEMIAEAEAEANTGIPAFIGLLGSAWCNRSVGYTGKVISVDATMSVDDSVGDEGLWGQVGGSGQCVSAASFSPEQATTRLEINLFILATGGGNASTWGPAGGSAISATFGDSETGWVLTAIPQANNDQWLLTYTRGNEQPGGYSIPVGPGVNVTEYDEFNAPTGEDFDDDDFAIQASINMPTWSQAAADETVGEIYGFSSSVWITAAKDD